MIGDSLKQLVVLVADLDAENAVQGILSRCEALGIHRLSSADVDIHRHVQRDSGCCAEAHQFLRPFAQTHRFALVVFDRHGSGRGDCSAEDIEAEVEHRLSTAGWVDRCAVVVPDPELETWVWSDSPNVDAELGWAGQQPSLRQWLVSQRAIQAEHEKPVDPKTAMFMALRQQRKPLSPRLFRRLAERVSLQRCQDRAFLKLRNSLVHWFAEGH